jgi:hypothetical protein
MNYELHKRLPTETRKGDKLRITVVATGVSPVEKMIQSGTTVPTIFKAKTTHRDAERLL